MFALILTLTPDFLAITRALAAEFPHMYICTDAVQELKFRPEVSEAEVRHWQDNYLADGHYERVELVWVDPGI